VPLVELQVAVVIEHNLAADTLQVIPPLNHVLDIGQPGLQDLSLVVQVIKGLVVEAHVGQNDPARIRHKRTDLVHFALELDLLAEHVLQLVHVELDLSGQVGLEDQLEHEVLLFVVEGGRPVQLSH